MAIHYVLFAVVIFCSLFAYFRVYIYLGSLLVRNRNLSEILRSRLNGHEGNLVTSVSMKTAGISNMERWTFTSRLGKRVCNA